MTKPSAGTSLPYLRTSFAVKIDAPGQAGCNVWQDCEGLSKPLLLHKCLFFIILRFKARRLLLG